MAEKTPIVAKGGGWYYPLGGSEEDDKFQMSKKDLKKSDYEVVELVDESVNEVTVNEPAEDRPANPGVLPSSSPDFTEKQLKKAQAQEQSWGPYDDYVFVTTPYGEYGVPAGWTLTGFEPNRNADGKLYMKPIYDKTTLTRTPAEIAALRDERAERDQVFD